MKFIKTLLSICLIYLSFNLNSQCDEVFVKVHQMPCGIPNDCYQGEQYTTLNFDDFDGNDIYAYPHFDIVHDLERNGNLFWNTQYEANDGTLKIKAEKVTNSPDNENFFLGGRIDSKTSHRYGRYTLRAAVPYQEGAWPSFWLFGGGLTGYSELDIFEFAGKSENPWVGSSFHKNCTEGQANPRHYFTNDFDIDQSSWNSSAFKDYVLEWTPFFMKTSIDGAEVSSIYQYYKYCGGTDFILDNAIGLESYDEISDALSEPGCDVYEFAYDQNPGSFRLSIGNKCIAEADNVPPSIIEIDFYRYEQLPSLTTSVVTCVNDPNAGNADCCYDPIFLASAKTCKEMRFQAPGPTIPADADWSISSNNYRIKYFDNKSATIEQIATNNAGILTLNLNVDCPNSTISIDLSEYFLTNETYTIESMDVQACNFYAEVGVKEFINKNLIKVYYTNKWGYEYELEEGDYETLNRNIFINYPPYTRLLRIETPCREIQIEIEGCEECCPEDFESNGEHCKIEINYPGFEGLVIDNNLYAIPKNCPACLCPPNIPLVQGIPGYGSLCDFGYSVNPNFDVTAWGTSFYAKPNCDADDNDLTKCCPPNAQYKNGRCQFDFTLPTGYDIIIEGNDINIKPNLSNPSSGVNGCPEGMTLNDSGSCNTGFSTSDDFPVKAEDGEIVSETNCFTCCPKGYKRTEDKCCITINLKAWYTNYSEWNQTLFIAAPARGGRITCPTGFSESPESNDDYKICMLEISEEYLTYTQSELLICPDLIDCRDVDKIRLNGNASELKAQINSSDKNTLKLKDNSSDQNEIIKVYPNPFQHTLTIVLSEDSFSNNEEYEVNILSMDGKVVYTDFIKQPISEINLKTQLLSGLYFLEVSSNDKIFNRIKIATFNE